MRVCLDTQEYIYVPAEASQFDELSGKDGDQYMPGLENEAEIKDSELRFAFAVYIHSYGSNFQLRQKGVLPTPCCSQFKWVICL